ncbi:DsbC family protein [Arcobacter sp. YIC-464]|uniref:DsbC family protein n=1 Tax=Arcobacter sp. YIC-464 TaxID=3376631 RepID=UPI003C207B34
MKYILILCLFLSSIWAKNKDVEFFNNLQIVKQNGIEVNEFREYDSIYLLKGTRNTPKGTKALMFYMTKDLKYTFFGRAIENSVNEPLYIKRDMSKYKKFANFAYGNGKEEYYLFTDPECPYCKKFEKELSNLDIKDKVKIYYFLYPLAFHKEAVAMSNYILSKDNRYEALKDVLINNSKEYKSFSNKKSEELEKNISLTLELAVRGTPSLYDKNGKRLNYQEFLNKLK